MAKTSLIITSTAAADGKKLQKTLTDINSAATNEQLKSFAQILNGLTTNNYAETNRVDRVNCDTESGTAAGDGNQLRNLTITGAERGATATLTATIVEDETINPLVIFMSGNTAQYIEPEDVGGEDPEQAVFEITVPDQSGTLFAGIVEKNTEWEKFYADFIRVTVS